MPLADLVSVGFGRAGRDATAVLAVALTMGTMNVYLGGAAKLAASLADDGRAATLARRRRAPKRPAAAARRDRGDRRSSIFAGLVAGLSTTEDLVRATSALFIAVYVLAILSAVRILDGAGRGAALAALALILVLAVFSAQFLLVPAIVAVGRAGAAAQAVQGCGPNHRVEPGS